MKEQAMTSTDNCSGTSDAMRRRAEEMLREKVALSPEVGGVLSPDEARLALHELSVHQIELEMQNEEMRRSKAELDASQARYVDLYDFAPVGYLTLNKTGLILEANFSAATLLGVIRGMLVSRPISKYIFKDDQDGYYLFRKQLFETDEPQTCELRMLKIDGSVFWSQMSATVAQNADGEPVCRLMLFDITERKHAEEALLASEIQLQGIIESTAEGLLAVDNEGKVVKANSRFAELWRVPESLLKSHDDNALLSFVLEQLSEPEAFLKKVQLLYKSDATDMDTITFKDGRVFERYSIPFLSGNRVMGRVWSFRDITERIQAEVYRDTSLNVLQILNGSDDLQESIRRVIAFVKTQTGADAVGLRLQDGEDFPYYAQEGFPDNFLLTENFLDARGPDGGTCRDNDGKICLECTCGLVISGKTDPTNPLFTRGGEFLGERFRSIARPAVWAGFPVSPS
jgi:PAS domain S-box-containing protein